MFGKLFKKDLLIGLILLGFCLYIVKLYIQGDINLYTHPRYNLFALLMSGLAVAVLVVGLFLDLLPKHRPSSPPREKIKLLDVVAVVVLGLALLLPAQALSPTATSRKSVNTPDYAGDQSTASLPCPTERPSSIEAWVYEISQYPINCYLGHSIELTGFVLEAPDNPLPDDMYYLGRVVVSCCVVDARPYALPIKQGQFEKHAPDTWLKVSGKLQATKVNGKIQLVVEPSSVIETDRPEDVYDYIGGF